MIRTDQIPDEVVEAAAIAIAESLRTARLTLEAQDGYRPEARAAIAAALSAWPGAGQDQCDNLILPLPQKDGDA